MTRAAVGTRAKADWSVLEAAYRRVLEAIPNQYIASNNLALLLLTEGRPAESEALVVEEAKAADHPANVHSQWIAAQVGQGHLAEARRSIEQLRQRFPTAPTILWVEAFSLQAMGDLPGAERAWAGLAAVTMHRYQCIARGRRWQAVPRAVLRD